MQHPLVDQLRFTRSEWLRGLEGVSEEDGACHFGPMNCISWTVGHLAWHEQRTFLQRPQDILLYPHLNDLFASDAPAPSTAAVSGAEEALPAGVIRLRDGTKRRLRVHRIAHDVRAHQGIGGLDEPPVHRAMHVHPFHGATALAGVVHRAVDDVLDR